MTAIQRSRWSRLAVAGVLTLSLLGTGFLTNTYNAHGAALAPTSKNTLSIGWTIETKTLDPAGKTENPDIWVQVNVYDRLVMVGKDGKTILPDLATSWNVTNGGTVYTFHLRPGIKFHDGSPVTAKDVVFDINRARQPARLWAWTLTAVKKVQAVNASTVRFTLKHAWGPFLSDMSLFNTGIYPQAFFKRVGESGMATQTDGSGPYNVTVWKKGQYLRMQKTPSYWNAGAYPMQFIEYRVIPNDNTRLLETKAGQLDVDFEVPFNQISALGEGGSAAIRTDLSTRTLYIVPNIGKVKQLADINVRQAINHAIDRRGLIKAILFGHGTPASSFMPKGALWWNPNVPVPKFDLNLAKSYMAKSKYRKGFSLTMEVESGNSQYQQIDVILKSELAALGIKLNLKNMDPTTIFNNQDSGNYHMTNNQWTNDIPDPDELVSFAVDYSLGSKAFFTWYNNPQLGQMSRAAENTNNSAKRKQIYFQIQQQFAKDVPFFPLFYVPFVNAVSSKVHGFSENPLGYFNIQGVTKSG